MCHVYVYWGRPHSVWAAMLLSGIGGRCLTHDYERKVSNTLSPEVVLHWKEAQRKERKKDSIRGNVQLTWPKLKCFWLTEGNKRCTLFSSEVTIHGQGQGQIQGDHVPAARLKNKTQSVLTKHAECWTWAQQSAAGSVSHLGGLEVFSEAVSVTSQSCLYWFGRERHGPLPRLSQSGFSHNDIEVATFSLEIT